MGLFSLVIIDQTGLIELLGLMLEFSIPGPYSTRVSMHAAVLYFRTLLKRTELHLVKLASPACVGTMFKATKLWHRLK